MNEYVMRSINVTKIYGNHKVLDKVNMNIKKGDIYGFIGENGAGKTTMIRIIAGLSIPNDGQVLLFNSATNTVIKNTVGYDVNNAPNNAADNVENCTNDCAVNSTKDYTTNITKDRARIGSLIETPRLYLNMTARENLNLIKIQRGISGVKCIDEALNLVGLNHITNKKVKNFSLGMKQRLGIAMAILSDPEFLILDEPINGLDPMGIKNTRELLLKLNKERGTTILISSHILSELTQISNRYGFINNGKIIEEITHKELLNKCRSYLNLKVRDISKTSVILEKELGVKDFEVFSDDTIRIYDNFDSERISLCLASHKLGVKEIVQRGESLEDYFAHLIGGREND